MPKMIQIRNVPDELHRILKARASLEGKTLSDFLMEEVQRLAELPTIGDLRARLAKRSRTTLSFPPTQAVRAERDAH